MSKTKEYLDQYLAARPEKTSQKIRSMIDRHEVYDYEEKIGKSIFEMSVDEIIDMMKTFRRRGAQKSKLSTKTYDVICSLFRSFFSWYIDEVEVIKNPFNSPEFKAKYKNILTDVRVIGVTKESITKAINRLYSNENRDYAEYCEAIVRMAYEGFATTHDIVFLKESDIDILRRSVTIRGREHLLSSKLYELLVSIHNKDEMPAPRGVFAMISFEGSYFKFPTRESFVDVKREAVFWQSYISRLFRSKITPCFESTVSFRDIYIYGFYEHIVRKYGREEAERMILSDNDGRVNMILLDEADAYGVGENLSPTQLRKTVRQCVFPDR